MMNAQEDYGSYGQVKSLVDVVALVVALFLVVMLMVQDFLDRVDKMLMKASISLLLGTFSLENMNNSNLCMIRMRETYLFLL